MSPSLPLKSDWATIWVIPQPKHFRNCTDTHRWQLNAKQDGKWQPSSIRWMLEGRLTWGGGWWLLLGVNPTSVNEPSHSPRDGRIHTCRCALALNPEAISAGNSVTRRLPKLPRQLIWRVWYKQDILAVSLWVLAWMGVLNSTQITSPTCLLPLHGGVPQPL